MTEQLAPNQKKIVDWDKKSDSDAERISKRLEGRSELDDRTSTANDVSVRPVAERTAAPVRPATHPAAANPAASRPAPAAGQPLQRLRQKLKKFTTMMMTKTKTPPVSSISACWTKKKPKTAFSLQALFPTRPATSRKHCALPANSNWPESWTPFSAPQWPQEKPDCPPALPAPMPGWQIRQNMM